MIECNCMIPVMNYGSSASYKAEPSPEQIATGVIPLDSLPAAWWNCMWSQTNTAVNQARQELGQLIVELNNVLQAAGVCPQDVCTDQLYQSIEKIRQTLGNATTAGAVKSSTCPSEVAIDQTTGMMSVNCLGNAASLTTTARTVVGAVNELKSTYDCCFSDTATAIGGKAPTAHASSATTYGVGNADCYGHLKISDTYLCNLGCSGMAASQTAIACVYCCLTTVAAGVASLGNTAGCALGTAAAGTAITAARSDHVHPQPTFMPAINCSTSIIACRSSNGYTCIFTGNASGACTANDVRVAYAANAGSASSATCATSAISAGSATCATYARCAECTAYAVCANIANNVYATSHPGSWQINWNWDGTYFQGIATYSGSTLPLNVCRANAAGYADSAGSAGSATIAVCSCKALYTSSSPGGSYFKLGLGASGAFYDTGVWINGVKQCNKDIYIPIW